VAKSKSVLH